MPPVLPKAQHASTHTPREQHHQDQPTQQSLAKPQQQQDSSREWGSADKQEHSISRSARPDSRQSYGRGGREREGDREGRSAAAHGSRGDSERDREREGRCAGAYGGSGSRGDSERERGQARDRSSPSRDRQRERKQKAGRSSRDDRGHGGSGRQADSSYSRRSRDHDWRQAGRHDDSRHDRAAAADRDRDSSRQQFKWQVVEDRAGWPTRGSDKENSRGGYGGGGGSSSSRTATAAGKGRGGDDDTRFYDRSFGSRSSRPNRAEQEPAPGAAAAVAAAVKVLDTHNSSRAHAGQQQQQQTRPQPADKPSTTPLASRRYSSLRQQLGGGGRGRARTEAAGASDSDAPSPLRRQPVGLLGEDFMDWADGTPSCPDRSRGRAAHASWADDVEAAEALSNVCEVMMVMGHASSPLPAPGNRTAAGAAAAAGQQGGRQDSMELEEGEIGGDDVAAAAAGGQQAGIGSSAAVRPRSAGLKRTAACLGDLGERVCNVVWRVGC